MLIYRNITTQSHLTRHFPFYCSLMDTQSEPAAHSSIALLQERFRRLQKAKEMRKEREVLQLLMRAECITPATSHEASPLFFHSELILQPIPPLQGSLYKESSMQSMYTWHQVNETPFSSYLQQRDIVMYASSFKGSDVDTSLHL